MMELGEEAQSSLLIARSKRRRDFVLPVAEMQRLSAPPCGLAVAVEDGGARRGRAVELVDC
jgi:hypothetical protein